MTRFLPRLRPLFPLCVALVPVVARAENSESSIVDRLITIISSVVVPIVLALVGHRLGEARTRKEEEKVRAKSVFIPPPQPKTALNWLVEVGNVAAPTSQLISPSTNRRKWMPIAVTAALIGVGTATGVLVSRLMGSNDRPAPESTPATPAAAAAAAIPGVRYKMFVDKGHHFVRAGTDEGPAVGARINIADAKGARPAAPSTPSIPSAAAAPTALRGEVSISGFGPAKRLRLINSGSVRWTRCELRLPNNKRYRIEAVAAGDSDGIMLSRFEQDGVERDLEPTWLNVACTEGTARFNIRTQ